MCPDISIARQEAFERIKQLVGAEGAELLYIREENGRFYVDYRGRDRDALAATGELGVIVADAINSDVTVEYRVAYSDTVRTGDGRAVSLSQQGGAFTTVLSGSLIQIFVASNSDVLSTRAAAGQGARGRGDDGKSLVYYNDIVDAHEFGHARAAIRDRFYEQSVSVRWWQFGAKQALIDANNRASVTVENIARERRGLNKRTAH